MSVFRSTRDSEEQRIYMLRTVQDQINRAVRIGQAKVKGQDAHLKVVISDDVFFSFIVNRCHVLCEPQVEEYIQILLGIF